MGRQHQLKVRLGDAQTTMWLPFTGSISAKIRANRRFYEHNLLHAIRSMSIKGTYVDVGAHIGNHTVAFASLCDYCSDVVSIEPEAVNLKWLRQNADGRNKSVKVIEARCGCGDERVRLDALLADVDHVGLLKIDVGPELMDVLRSGYRIIRKHRPVLAAEAATAERFAELNRVMSAFGYAQVGQYAHTPTYVFVPTRVHVCVITHNRPKLLANLLKDIASTGKALVTRLSIYDDATKQDLSQAKEVTASMLFDVRWHRFDKPHGKKGFWEVVTQAFQDHSKLPDRELLIFLPDDIRLAKRFFLRALMRWNEICDRKKATLTLQAEQYRDSRPCWTGFAPERVHDNIWKTQWCDGLFLCPVGMVRKLGSRVPKPPESRWRNPEISSGVWQWFSQKLHAMGYGMYRVHRSLNVHVEAPSQMHGAHRLKAPIVAARFVDGATREARLLNTERVEASLATIPSREENLRKVVASLLPQVDLLRVYLNGYQHVPKFLRRSKKIICARSQDTGDRGDAGKFFWCEQAQGYQLTCDDDLIYGPLYVGLMVKGIERFSRRAVVGLHGVTLSQPSAQIQSYYRDRTLSHWKNPCRRDQFVHLLGTGVMAYHASAVKLQWDDFERPNMADVWMGLVCQQQKVPMVALARPSKLVHHLQSPWTIYDRDKHRDGPQTKAVRRIKSWAIHKPVKR